MKTIQQYIEAFGLDSDRVVYRAGAPFTAQFGLDSAFGVLRLHMGVDRGRGTIYAPFSGKMRFDIDFPDRFGNLLVIDVEEYGFEVRIAHMEKLSDEALGLDHIRAGAYLGEAGAAGKSIGAHTHTEVVSKGPTSRVLDELMKMQGCEIDKPYTTEEAVNFSVAKGLVDTLPNVLKAYKDQVSMRKISFINKYVCDRIDYLTNEKRRFYSSRYAFEM